ncbi:16574_t:CDS:2, partial [Racocetra fulgida]
MTRHTKKRKYLQKITEDREPKKQCCSIYMLIDSLSHEELKKVQNHINLLNPQLRNTNIYEVINSLNQEVLKNIQTHINSLNPQLRNINIYEIINSLDQEELKNIQNYINSLNPQLQNINNKANEFVASSLFKHYSSEKDFQDKVKKLEIKNN